MRALGRPVAGIVMLAAVVWRFGFGPFRDGVHAVDGRALALAAVLGAVSTACCAWRWVLVARRHDLPLTFGAAVAAYYRSVFLNLTLPGGVVGDVHRGLRHGREAGGAGRALRAVAWERGIGQAVQAVVTAAVLVLLPSPVRGDVPVPLAITGLGAAAAGCLVLRRRWRLSWSVLSGVTAASLVVVSANAAMFVVAARTAGVSAPAARLAPLALVAMLAMVLPGIAGWGPREGATAWAFAAAGLGAAAGVATAVVYGMMALSAAVPGAVVLIGAWLGDVARTAPTGEAADA
ncbi:MAG TPA: lysylphosphatidylglycerol synthase domain-containing protein [Gaiellales bacterium]|nr:lysylphosphatidylglycerol synthase domain-containing protein [Gaiellales bacterium]